MNKKIVISTFFLLFSLIAVAASAISSISSSEVVVVDWEELNVEEAKKQFLKDGVVEREQDGIVGRLENLYPTSPYIYTNDVKAQSYYKLTLKNTDSEAKTVKAYIYSDYINPEIISTIKDINTNEPAEAEYVSSDVVVIKVDMEPNQIREYRITRADVLKALPQTTIIEESQSHTINATENDSQNIKLPEKYRNTTLSVYEQKIMEIIGYEIPMPFAREEVDVDKHGHVLAFKFDEPRNYNIKIEKAGTMVEILFPNTVVE